MVSVIISLSQHHIPSMSVYLPDELKAKTVSLEKEIYELQKQWTGTSDAEAKYQYVTKVRALPTFGANFFLVREPEGGRKMVPLLLGIRHDSILRVNSGTKETLATFPLSNVKRWASSGQVFSVDFGGHHKNLSVETWDGKKISDLLDQYVKTLLESKSFKILGLNLHIYNLFFLSPGRDPTVCTVDGINLLFISLLLPST